MINDREVIVLNYPDRKIDIVNLDSHNILHVNHDFLFDDTASAALYTFPETKYFAIVEYGSQSDNRFRLTYFSYDGLNEHSKPLTVWDAKEGEWSY